MNAIEFLVFFKIYFNLLLEFFKRFFKIFQKKKFELARGPFNTGKIRIGEGTSTFVRITEHFELLDFELVSFDYRSLETQDR